jgi:hypothetical protein
MTKNEGMKEYQVIMHVVKHLMQKGWTILNISVRTKNEREKIRKELNLGYEIFQKGEADIVARRWKGRRILIEAKGGTYKYGIYTALGQMVCTLDDTRYNWFALAFPQEWREPLEKRIEKSTILRLVNDDSQKKDKRLFFYFVDSKGVVKEERWSKLLKS